VHNGRVRGFEHNERAGGVILHPTSLPGPYGIGDLGPEAHRWIDLLGDSGTGLWQVLPLGPTGFADSPYAALSSFAGNLNLISPDLVAADGLGDWNEPPASAPPTRVDYGSVIPAKEALIARASTAFAAGAGSPDLGAALAAFRAGAGHWLEDYALYVTCKRLNDGRAWWDWDGPLRLRAPDALRTVRREHAAVIDEVVFGQFLFSRQWTALRRHAAERAVRIIGDVPFFVAGDSADVWSQPELFDLAPDGTPNHVAGVPPDYFSTTGQLWGNPQYRWERHAADGFSWWLDRLGAAFDQVDLVRIDHFRAFADYWEIPAGRETAVDGRWRDGPGLEFFTAVGDRFESVPIIAEDLGEMSPKVPDLLAAVGFPGMRVLQFAFEGETDDPFLPHRYPLNTVAYTGTHDNDTTLGWWQAARPAHRAAAAAYLDADPGDPVAAFLEALWGSAALLVLAPLQDFLRLGSSARMNSPGTTDGNWQWRAPELTADVGHQLMRLNAAHGRSSGIHVS